MKIAALIAACTTVAANAATTSACCPRTKIMSAELMATGTLRSVDSPSRATAKSLGHSVVFGQDYKSSNDVQRRDQTQNMNSNPKYLGNVNSYPQKEPTLSKEQIEEMVAESVRNAWLQQQPQALPAQQQPQALPAQQQPQALPAQQQPQALPAQQQPQALPAQQQLQALPVNAQQQLQALPVNAQHQLQALSVNAQPSGVKQLQILPMAASRTLSEDSSCIAQRGKYLPWGRVEDEHYLLQGPIKESDLTRFIYDMSFDESYWKFADETQVPNAEKIATLRINTPPIFQDGWQTFIGADPGQSCSTTSNWTGSDLVLSLKDRRIIGVFIISAQHIAAWNLWYADTWQFMKNFHDCGSGCMLAVTVDTGDIVTDTFRGIASIPEPSNQFSMCDPCAVPVPVEVASTLPESTLSTSSTVDYRKGVSLLTVSALLVSTILF